MTSDADADNRTLVGEWYEPQLADRRRRLDAHNRHQRPRRHRHHQPRRQAQHRRTHPRRRPATSPSRGYTGLRLGISGGQPSGDNYVQFATLEHSSSSRSRSSSSPTPLRAAPTAPVEHVGAGGVGGGAGGTDADCVDGELVGDERRSPMRISGSGAAQAASRSPVRRRALTWSRRRISARACGLW